METKLAASRIAERKLRDKQARREQIISAARRIAEMEGWTNVTVRRLSDEISYSQPVLYSHFGSREGILAAVAIEGFQELGLSLEKARKRAKRGNIVESVASAYLEFASSSPAMYEAMFSLGLSVPFDEAATPRELRFAFAQLLELFPGHGSKPEVVAELFWASLHGIAELTRTKRFPRSRQKERVRTLVELFTLGDEARAKVSFRADRAGSGPLARPLLVTGMSGTPVRGSLVRMRRPVNVFWGLPVNSYTGEIDLHEVFQLLRR